MTAGSFDFAPLLAAGLPPPAVKHAGFPKFNFVGGHNDAEHVPVDFELRGCPISKAQLLEVITAFLHGRRPAVSPHSVCVECKARGNVCVMVAHGTPCLGPVTHAGCNALCPSYHRGCYGCYGPAESPNAPALTAQLREMGVADLDLVRMLRTFNAAAPAFRAESEELTS